MFKSEVVEKIKTHTLRPMTSFRKSSPSWDNVEKYGRAGQATGDNIIRRMRIARWIPKAIDTHREYVIFVDFPRQRWLRERVLMLRSYLHYLSCS
jgi:hypothetical protein